jgi:hypothetical protein
MCGLWQWIVTNSAGLQAVAALLGVLGLGVYVWDTRKIRKATLLLAKDNLIAFLALTQLPKDEEPSVIQWKVQNQGSGTAINIKVWLPNNSNPRQKPSLMKGESFSICDVASPLAPLFVQQLKSADGFKTQYESLAGERFESVFWIRDEDTVEAKFDNLSRR